MPPRSALLLLPRPVRLWLLVAFLAGSLRGSALAESFFDTRFQYYQEDGRRIEVDSSYSLFSLDLNDTTTVDGSALYSAISGASPVGIPAFTKGAPVPVVGLTDERQAYTLGLGHQFGNQLLHAGFAYSNESDYLSSAYSLSDSIALNQKNTTLNLAFAYTDDIVGENGTPLHARKRSYDALFGITQVLSPDDLLSFDASLGWRHGFLSDPYKRALLNGFVVPDHRPDHRFEQLFTLAWTHHLPWKGASIETSYRFGHNDYGSHSNTIEFAFYQKLFGDRLIVRPAFRYYRQSAAEFYALEFTGDPRFYSSDYRLAAEQTFSASLELRWFIVKDRLSLDANYERYITQGTDGITSASAFPSANSASLGFHYQF